MRVVNKFALEAEYQSVVLNQIWVFINYREKISESVWIVQNVGGIDMAAYASFAFSSFERLDSIITCRYLPGRFMMKSYYYAGISKYMQNDYRGNYVVCPKMPGKALARRKVSLKNRNCSVVEWKSYNESLL